LVTKMNSSGSFKSSASITPYAAIAVRIAVAITNAILGDISALAMRPACYALLRD